MTPTRFLSLVLVLVVAGCAGPMMSDDVFATDSAAVVRTSRDGGRDAGGGDAGVKAVDAGSAVDAGLPGADGGADPGLCPSIPTPAERLFKGNPGLRVLRAAQLYVVYSGMKDVTNASYYNTSNIFVVRGLPRADGRTEVVVFGAGYSDPNGTVLAMRKTKDAMRSGSADAADVGTAIRCGLGLTTAETFVRFITPHWHIDHLNQAFLSALKGLGFEAFSVETHALDAVDAYSGYASATVATVPAWTPDITTHAITVGSIADSCGALAFTFESFAFGTWRAVVTPGHTSGTLSLENTTLGIRLNGSDTTTCAASAGLREMPIHGDVGSL